MLKLKEYIYFGIICMLVVILKIPCIFNKITGLFCPGCGITRMFISIIKLEFYQAFRYNSLIFIYLVFIVLSIIYIIFYKLFNKKNKIKNILKFNKFIYTILIITIIFGIIRNINIFSYLKPTLIN